MSDLLKAAEDVFYEALSGNDVPGVCPVPREKWDALWTAIEAERAKGDGWKDTRTPDAIALDNVAAELRSARRQWGNMASPHEAHSVILEEVEEFWEEVKANKGDANLRKVRMSKELVQVAAMAVRAMVDIAVPQFEDEYQGLPAPPKETP